MVTYQSLSISVAEGRLWAARHALLHIVHASGLAHCLLCSWGKAGLDMGGSMLGLPGLRALLVQGAVSVLACGLFGKALTPQLHRNGLVGLGPACPPCLLMRIHLPVLHQAGP